MSVLTLVAGLAFGVTVGLSLVLLSATIGATLAFLVARRLLHRAVSARLAGRPSPYSVSESGWRHVVMLLRLSPRVSFNLQNTSLASPTVLIGAYVAATFFGMVPKTPQTA
ncbi:VTT domain-containing protein [Methylibium sp.]|uniref:VTT domain-containing protein n=1 Tax=Methylibium sp. TaxID=2067992 RepID=UPI0017C976F9|nr:VTT domain-containing protein [Methylibium sp.]MBA3590884.1 TVP38/TMEM64 family protein [Methylibium sp.]